MKPIARSTITTWILAALLLTLTPHLSAQVESNAFSTIADSAFAQDPIDIEVYVRNGCPHCEKAELFLQSLKSEFPTLKIVIRDVIQDPAAFAQLDKLAKTHATTTKVPAFRVGNQLIIGYTDELTSGQLIRNALKLSQPYSQTHQDASSCEADLSLTCSTTGATKDNKQSITLNFLGSQFSSNELELPLFTIIMGLLDGFNPCSMWVLILMISLLAPMKNRPRMFVIAGTFVAVEGLAYFVFMAAWLNLFLFIGLSRISEIAIGVIALTAGAINLKDFWFYGQGISLSIPDSAKPDIYARMRNILHAKNLTGALIGAVILAILVQLVEFMCTSGFPALYTRLLTLKQLDSVSYYSYLLLYNVAYMLDDIIILSIGIVTLSQRRLQEKEGRWLKLLSGLVMVALAVYLLNTSH